MSVHPHGVPPETKYRQRGGERTQIIPAPLTQGYTKPPGATAQLAEPEPNPAGRGAEPNVYITHPTHGAGARPGKTQPPTATRKTTPNADQCERQPREGRGGKRQTPPPNKNREGGRENGPQPPNRPTTPQEVAQPPTQAASKTGPPKGTPEDNSAKTSNTKPGAAAHREKRHPKHADTHHAGTKQKKENKQRSPKEKGWRYGDHETQDRNNHLGFYEVPESPN